MIGGNGEKAEVGGGWAVGRGGEEESEFYFLFFWESRFHYKKTQEESTSVERDKSNHVGASLIQETKSLQLIASWAKVCHFRNCAFIRIWKNFEHPLNLMGKSKSYHMLFFLHKPQNLKLTEHLSIPYGGTK